MEHEVDLHGETGEYRFRGMKIVLEPSEVRGGLLYPSGDVPETLLMPWHSHQVFERALVLWLASHPEE